WRGRLPAWIVPRKVLCGTGGRPHREHRGTDDEETLHETSRADLAPYCAPPVGAGAGPPALSVLPSGSATVRSRPMGAPFFTGCRLTVTVSPTLNELRAQPRLVMSVGLLTSTAQLRTPPVSSIASNFRKQCGFAQIHSVTVPFSVRSFAVSKLAVPWCAATGVDRTRRANAAAIAPKYVPLTANLQVRIKVENRPMTVKLFPAVDRLPLQRIGGQLRELDAHAVEVRHVRQPRVRKRARRAGVARGRAAGAEHLHRVLDAVHREAEVADARGPLRVRLLDLDEGVAAHLHVRRHQLAVGSVLVERFAEPHLLRVEGERVGHARHRDADVVHVHLRALLRETGLDRKADEDSCGEQGNTTHGTLLQAGRSGRTPARRGDVVRTVLHARGEVKRPRRLPAIELRALREQARRVPDLAARR